MTRYIYHPNSERVYFIQQVMQDLYHQQYSNLSPHARNWWCSEAWQPRLPSRRAWYSQRVQLEYHYEPGLNKNIYHACICIRIYLHIYIYMYMHLYTNICICIYMFTTYIYIYIHRKAIALFLGPDLKIGAISGPSGIGMSRFST